jgi:hypothetical protein
MNRLLDLEVNGSVLDLENDIVAEFTIVRVQGIVGSPRSVDGPIPPGLMIVINEATPEYHS